MVIEALEQNVISQLRSSSSIDSVSQCVAELVLNSLDAKSTAITVRVDLQKCNIQVVDNGKGISRSSLEHVAVRYMTSKCHTLADLKKRLKFYGFRGEALANIAKLSKQLIITTREEHSDETYSKTVKNEESQIELVKSRPSVGTTVIVVDFLGNFPVRKQCIKNSELETVKKCLESLAIIRPEVSFSLRNDLLGKIIFKNQKCADITTSFVHIHNFISTDGFTVLKMQKDKISVQGLIHKNLHENRKLQYIYVNKRPIANKKIQSLINNLYKKANRNPETKHRYPVFMINIRCPYSDVDLTLEPTKTVVLFKKYDLVKRCIEKIIYTILGIKNETKISTETRGASVFGVSQITGAVKGCAKRKSSEVIDIIPEKSSKIIEATPPPQFVRTNLQHKVALPIVIKKPLKISDYYDDNNDNNDDDNIIEDEQNHAEAENTFLTNFPDDEQKGKDFIMDMFIKSVRVYSEDRNTSNENSEPSAVEAQNKISLGVQTTLKDVSVVEVEKMKSVGIQADSRMIRFDSELARNNNEAARDQPKTLKHTSSEFQTKFDNFAAETRYYPLEIPKSINIDDRHEVKPTFCFKTSDLAVPKTAECDRRETFKKYFQPRQQCQEIDQTFFRDDMALYPRKSLNLKKYISDYDYDFSIPREFNDNPLLEESKKLFDFRLNRQERCNNVSDDYRFVLKDKHLRTFNVTRLETARLSPIPKPITQEFSKKEKPSRRFSWSRKKSSNDDYRPTFNFKPSQSSNNNLPETITCPVDKKNVDKNQLPDIILTPFKPSKSAKKNLHETTISKYFNTKFTENFLRNSQQNREVSTNFDTHQLLSPEKVDNLTVGNFLDETQKKPEDPPDISINTDCVKSTSDLFPQNDDQIEERLIQIPQQTSNLDNDLFSDVIISPRKPSKSAKTNLNETTVSKYFDTKFTENFLRNSQQKLEGNYLEVTQKRPEEPSDISKNPNCDLIPETIDVQNDSELIITIDDQIDIAQPTQQPKSDWVEEVNDFGKVIYVNQKTGFRSICSPKKDVNFDFAGRYAFMPKGLSPILKDYGKVNPLSPESKITLQNEVIKSYDDELILVKWQSCVNNKDPKTFFEEIYLEKSKLIEDVVPNVNKADLAKHVAKLFDCRSFTKTIFNNLDIIGQLDCKFIVVFEKRQNLIILFDQHAVHERIRLEMLLEGYKGASTKVDQKVTIFLPQTDLQLIINQKLNLNSQGLVFDFFTDGIIISQVPLCIYNKHKKGVALFSLVETLIKEIIETLKSDNGLLITTPKLIQNIVNSEACRGAIKFGDPLTKNECLMHLKNLSHCKLPFQCAHGRPTITPLITVNKDQNLAEFSKPNLRKLLDPRQQ